MGRRTRELGFKIRISRKILIKKNAYFIGNVLLIVAISVIAMLVYEWYEEYRGSVTATLAKKNAFVQWTAMAVPMIVLLLFGLFRGSYISSEFIYKQY